MEQLTLKERFWGCLAHVPLITIIWVGYLMYFHFQEMSLTALSSNFKIINIDSLPITPIILTLLSIPISLTIMHLQKTSAFVYANANSAYRFNIWLVTNYIIAFFFGLLGITTGIIQFMHICGTIVLIVSAISLIQACTGVVTALRGNIYRYWIPWTNKRF